MCFILLCSISQDQTFDLFDKLGATDEQLDFPVIYASALDGYAGTESDVRSGNMDPLFEAIVEHVEQPQVDLDGPLQLRQRFCPDYSLSVNFAPGFGAAAVLGAMQGVEVMSEFENAARLKVATNAVKLSELFRTMEYGIEQGYWTDWGVEKESLENVFLSVVEDDIISV